MLSRSLIALGKAHDILLGGAAERAPSEAVVREGIGALEGISGRVQVSGPRIEVCAKAAFSRALMLHEMTTNAVKYGALSVPEGAVDVAWAVMERIDGSVLRLSWRERSGPPVEPPSQGFRDALIKRGLTGQVGGIPALEYPPEGVTCVVGAPLRNFRDDGRGG